MKYLIFAAFALLSIAATAQDRQQTADSLGLLVRTGNTFFQTRYIKFDNGESETYTTIVGDSTAANLYLANQANDAANVFSQAAITVLQRGVVVNKIRDINAALESATGQKVMDILRALHYRQLVDTVGVDKSYTWRSSSNTNISIRYLSNGNLRFTGLPGLPVNTTRTADMMGSDWVRINNYPTDSVTHLYRLRDGRWFTIDRAIELRRVGINVQNQGQ